MESKTWKRFKIFKGLDEESIQKVDKFLTRKEVKKDEILWKENSPQSIVLFIESGEIERIKGNKLIDILGDGDTSGLLHALEKDPAFATCKGSAEKSVVWTLSAEDLASLMNHVPFASAISSYLAKEMRKLSKYARLLESVTKTDSGAFRVLFFDSKDYTEEHFNKVEKSVSERLPEEKRVSFTFIKDKLSVDTAYLAAGYKAVCIFVNDQCNADIVHALSLSGIKLILLRCAGYDNVDLDSCYRENITVARVPAYSPYAVAEHAMALILTLNRKIHRASSRTREANFSLSGLMGFDIHGKTIGVIGTGKIGRCFINICLGFGVKVLCYDKYPNDEVKAMKNVSYVDDLEDLLARSDIVSIHVPLLPSTKHLINADTISNMKKGIYIINTSRGGIVDNEALIEGLISGHISGAGLDVLEGEKDYFFEDHSAGVISEPLVARLVTMNNVIVTAHQAFFTIEAFTGIVESTVENLVAFIEGKRGKEHPNAVYQEY